MFLAYLYVNISQQLLFVFVMKSICEYVSFIFKILRSKSAAKMISLNFQSSVFERDLKTIFLFQKYFSRIL